MRIFATRLPLVLVTLLSLSLAPNVAGMFAADTGTDPASYSNDWRTTGPPGGDVRGLVVDPSNPDRFYFGTLDGQIYTSADAGKNWQLLYNLGKPRLFVDHIIVDPRNPKVLYVGAHRHDQPGGFFKSTDGGQTWRENSQLKNEAIHSLAQSDSNPNTLIAGTFKTIFRSEDAGETWMGEAVLSETSEAQEQAFWHAEGTATAVARPGGPVGLMVSVKSKHCSILQSCMCDIS